MSKVQTHSAETKTPQHSLHVAEIRGILPVFESRS